LTFACRIEGGVTLRKILRVTLALIAIIGATGTLMASTHLGKRSTHDSVQQVAEPASTLRHAHAFVPRNEVVGVTLECLSREVIESIRRNPPEILSAYNGCQSDLQRHLESWGLRRDQRYAIFAALVAHRMAPYGESLALTLDDLLAARQLDCHTYVALTGYLLRFLPASDYRLRFLGFDGGVIGNHAQLLFETRDQSILLDPTIGMIAMIGYDELMMGAKVDPDRVFSAFAYKDSDIDLFERRVVDAVIEGRYRPSDALYYFQSLDDYIAFSRSTERYWKSDLRQIVRSFPAPGAVALSRELLASERYKQR
jgi:hypothetical protein